MKIKELGGFKSTIAYSRVASILQIWKGQVYYQLFLSSIIYCDQFPRKTCKIEARVQYYLIETPFWRFLHNLFKIQMCLKVST